MGLLLIYILLTIVRSLRDDFSVEIWQDLGVDDEPSVFAKSEFWVMVGVIAVNGMAVLIRNNRFALLTSLTCIGGGFIMILGTLLAHQANLLTPMGFMVLLGLGMYLPYVAFHTTVFERLIAAFRETGTVAYLMYLADAFGYLGYVGVMIFRNYASDELSYLNLLVWVAASIGIFSFVISCLIGVYYYQSNSTRFAGDRR